MARKTAAKPEPAPAATAGPLLPSDEIAVSTAEWWALNDAARADWRALIDLRRRASERVAATAGELRQAGISDLRAAYLEGARDFACEVLNGYRARSGDPVQGEIVQGEIVGAPTATTAELDVPDAPTEVRVTDPAEVEAAAERVAHLADDFDQGAER